MPGNFWLGRRPLFPLSNKGIDITIGVPVEFDLPKMRQTAVSMSRDLSPPTMRCPVLSPYGLDEAAQIYLYMTLSHQLQTPMERLRSFIKLSESKTLSSCI